MNKLMEAGRNGQTDADMLSLSMSCNVDSNKTYTTTNDDDIKGNQEMERRDQTNWSSSVGFGFCSIWIGSEVGQ